MDDLYYFDVFANILEEPDFDMASVTDKVSSIIFNPVDLYPLSKATVYFFVSFCMFY